MSQPILEEPILKENKDRFVLFPITQHEIWKFLISKQKQVSGRLKKLTSART
jgi:hypothetical protein